jgi:hypothetical protein
MDAVLDRPGSERVSHVNEAAMLDACGTKRRRPFAVTELLDVDLAAQQRLGGF